MSKSTTFRLSHSGRAFVADIRCVDYSEDEVLLQMRTNVFGPMYLTQAILPQSMSLALHYTSSSPPLEIVSRVLTIGIVRARRGGTIVNMSSFAAHVGVPAAGVYNMSKFALEGWTEALALEVSEFGITVLIPVFGHFRTSFLNAFATPKKGIVAGYEGSAAEEGFGIFAPYNGHQPGSPEKGVKKLLKWIEDGGVLNGQKLQRVIVGMDAIGAIEGKVAELSKTIDQSTRWETEESSAI